ncbi:sporangia induced phosphatidyl inositol kinase [Thraustotheca clavata]|uniref:Sporangia induced phosphatidyl inositol kinase n=1 Tax=Thraustotheca clavata TaxID=74557 RepID=A0A1W0AAX0_9STRA|nr:sporangia induced phosphatidyl inositol kinase [Thraustotheca clavata]
MVTKCTYFNGLIGALKKKDNSQAITPNKVVLNPLVQQVAILNELEEMTLKEELYIFEQQCQVTLLRIPISTKQQKQIEEIVSQFASLSYEVLDNQILITKGNISQEAEVFVNVPQLATQGHDAFISYLRQDRMDSSGGQRSDMLWDVAETQNNNEDAFDAVNEGEGGVYAVSSLSGKKVAMFKPAEEEVFVREGLKAGEGAVREEAAYVIDSANGSFSGVPPTAVAQLYMTNSKSIKPSSKSTASHFKLGAVQRFMNSRMGSLDDFGMPHSTEKASQFVSVDQVHRVGILDIRLFNTDRHPGNILLLGDSPPYSLVPIDHGCILPSWDHLSEARLDWLSYPQAHVPFSTQTIEYINHLNPTEDARRLRRLGIREECITTLRICTMVLQEATKAGKTLHWIGSLLQREGCFEVPSALENLICQACDACNMPYSLRKCDTGEIKFLVEQGILSRRPPDVFHDCLKRVLINYLNSST